MDAEIRSEIKKVVKDLEAISTCEDVSGHEGVISDAMSELSTIQYKLLKS